MEILGSLQLTSEAKKPAVHNDISEEGEIPRNFLPNPLLNVMVTNGRRGINGTLDSTVLCWRAVCCTRSEMGGALIFGGVNAELSRQSKAFQVGSREALQRIDVSIRNINKIIDHHCSRQRLLVTSS